MEAEVKDYLNGMMKKIQDDSEKELFSQLTERVQNNVNRIYKHKDEHDEFVKVNQVAIEEINAKGTA